MEEQPKMKKKVTFGKAHVRVLLNYYREDGSAEELSSTEVSKDYIKKTPESINDSPMGKKRKLGDGRRDVGKTQDYLIDMKIKPILKKKCKVQEGPQEDKTESTIEKQERLKRKHGKVRERISGSKERVRTRTERGPVKGNERGGKRKEIPRNSEARISKTEEKNCQDISDDFKQKPRTDKDSLENLDTRETDVIKNTRSKGNEREINIENVNKTTEHDEIPMYIKHKDSLLVSEKRKSKKTGLATKDKLKSSRIEENERGKLKRDEKRKDEITMDMEINETNNKRQHDRTPKSSMTKREDETRRLKLKRHGQDLPQNPKPKQQIAVMSKDNFKKYDNNTNGQQETFNKKGRQTAVDNNKFKRHDSRTSEQQETSNEKGRQIAVDKNKFKRHDSRTSEQQETSNKKGRQIAVLNKDNFKKHDSRTSEQQGTFIESITEKSHTKDVVKSTEQGGATLGKTKEFKDTEKWEGVKNVGSMSALEIYNQVYDGVEVNWKETKESLSKIGMEVEEGMLQKPSEFITVMNLLLDMKTVGNLNLDVKNNNTIRQKTGSLPDLSKNLGSEITPKGLTNNNSETYHTGSWESHMDNRGHVGNRGKPIKDPVGVVKTNKIKKGMRRSRSEDILGAVEKPGGMKHVKHKRCHSVDDMRKIAKNSDLKNIGNNGTFHSMIKRFWNRIKKKKSETESVDGKSLDDNSSSTGLEKEVQVSDVRELKRKPTLLCVAQKYKEQNDNKVDTCTHYYMDESGKSSRMKSKRNAELENKVGKQIRKRNCARKANDIDEGSQSDEESELEETSSGTGQENTQDRQSNHSQKASKVRETTREANQVEEASKVQEAMQVQEPIQIEETNQVQKAKEVIQEAIQIQEANKVEEVVDVEEASVVQKCVQIEEVGHILEPIQVEKPRRIKNAKKVTAEGKETNQVGATSNGDEVGPIDQIHGTNGVEVSESTVRNQVEKSDRVQGCELVNDESETRDKRQESQTALVSKQGIYISHVIDDVSGNTKPSTEGNISRDNQIKEILFPRATNTSKTRSVDKVVQTRRRSRRKTFYQERPIMKVKRIENLETEEDGFLTKIFVVCSTFSNMPGWEFCTPLVNLGHNIA